MPEFLCYTPETGVRRMFDLADGRMVIRAEQDVAPLLDRNAAARNERVYDSRKATFRFYCSIPPVVQLELRRRGIDIYSKDPAMIRRMFRVINSEFPHLKVTDKRHE